MASHAVDMLLKGGSTQGIAAQRHHSTGNEVDAIVYSRRALRQRSGRPQLDRQVQNPPRRAHHAPRPPAQAPEARAGAARTAHAPPRQGNSTARAGASTAATGSLACVGGHARPSSCAPRRCSGSLRVARRACRARRSHGDWLARAGWLRASPGVARSPHGQCMQRPVGARPPLQPAPPTPGAAWQAGRRACRAPHATASLVLSESTKKDSAPSMAALCAAAQGPPARGASARARGRPAAGQRGRAAGGGAAHRSSPAPARSRRPPGRR